MPTPLSTDQALLSFFLGPVQSFIEAAKTTRDLWAGSYLLSWLTVAAMRPLLVRDDVEFVSPAVAGNPVIDAHFRAHQLSLAAPFVGTVDRDRRLLPCLPNRFLARVPLGDAAPLAAGVRDHCAGEWRRVANAVRDEVKPKLDALPPGWDDLWEPQVESLFEVRVVVLPTNDPERLRKLALDGADTGWAAEFDVVSGMLDAERSVRHVPAYHIGDRDVPQKCTLLGTYEQLGPAELRASKQFWKGARAKTKTRGGAVRPRERLCAVSVVKRFAWPHYLFEKLRQGEPPEEFRRKLRFADTATTAARKWLAEGQPVPREEDDDWSGQWLHWSERVPRKADPDDDPEDPCPPAVWDAIQRKKADEGKPPAYYGVLMLDGDGLGKLLRGPATDESPNTWGVEHERPGNISRRLTEFALGKVGRIVERHSGELVYSGGDDTLALLPAGEAVACAQELAGRYGQVMEGNTVSAGLAVVHYKEDLRFALEQARNAEKAAKNAGRDRLALSVCRRSGEHTTATLAWDEVVTFSELVGLFVTHGVSDRWAYQLRELLPTLVALPEDAVAAEVGRRIDRTDVPLTVRGEQVRSTALDLLRGRLREHRDQLGRRNATDPPKTPAEAARRHERMFEAAVTEFVTLCQSASFLARGRDR